MEQPTSPAPTAPEAPPAANRPPAPGRKRSSSGAGGLLSKLPFMRSTGEHRPRSRRNTNETDPAVPAPTPTLPIPSFTAIPAETRQRHVPASAAAPPPLPHILQHSTLQTAQQKTRRRRGSLRKVALLGRGAQRERREGRGLTIDTTIDDGSNGIPVEIVSTHTGPIPSSPGSIDGRTKAIPIRKDKGGNLSYGLGISDLTPRPSMDGYTVRSDTSTSDPDATPTAALAPTMKSPSPHKPTADTSLTINYSTTDDEDALHMARSSPASLPIPRATAPSLSLSSSSAISLLRPDRASLSSGSESYYLTRPPGISSSNSTAAGGALPSIQRRRSATIQRAKSPLGLTALAAPLQPQPDADWDYAETEWWGWIILVVTWTVFVIGMGSCLGVWSWAWDVGTTPYAPPELEDDPTLPIVGYYPALMILTGVMAWVWVVVAWVGMKYFRHAQVSGD
ncbi:hypothetical protein C8A01DRAFT_49649 [Parachaetomium inaequale]|uniref:Uncharacterized protein n=1 Tax=Parachaetomium inaequale TaxID=2588326 RepID=A0AAN6PD68_9PEZI|nr:hypothetical protein C8A01DRAFT_49649 [Parachaetomium inaequale]